MARDSEETRGQLMLADELVRRGQYAEAIDVYHRVASGFAERGFALKAVAICKQVIRILNADAPSLSQHAVPALRLLRDTYRALGLEADAVATDARLRGIEPPS